MEEEVDPYGDAGQKKTKPISSSSSLSLSWAKSGTDAVAAAREREKDLEAFAEIYTNLPDGLNPLYMGADPLMYFIPRNDEDSVQYEVVFKQKLNMLANGAAALGYNTKNRKIKEEEESRLE